MTWQRWSRRATLCASLVAGGAATHAQVHTGPDVVLVHVFRVPDGEAWGTVAIDLAAGAWHVGSASGPLAGEAQLRGTLRALTGLEIGGRCTGWVSGPTAYPCGFSLREVDLAGAVPQRYAAITVDQRSVATLRAASEVEVAQKHASSPRTPQLDEERFVALRLPAPYLGDKSQAFGGTLRFEIRALSNALVPSRFDRGSGQVILRARVAGQSS